MADPQSFWLQDEFSASRSGLSEEQIRESGARLGVRFPDSYAELFGVQNGGRVLDEELFLFGLPISDGPDDYGIVATVAHISGDDEFARELIDDEPIFGEPFDDSANE